MRTRDIIPPLYVLGARTQHVYNNVHAQIFTMCKHGVPTYRAGAIGAGRACERVQMRRSVVDQCGARSLIAVYGRCARISLRVGNTFFGAINAIGV